MYGGNLNSNLTELEIVDKYADIIVEKEMEKDKKDSHKLTE